MIPKTADWIRRFTPGVQRWVHYLLSGLMWSAVGIMLCSMAASWLCVPPPGTAVALAAAGLLLALGIYRFGFSRIAAKNLRRISEMQGNVCVFAFQEWKSYLIVIFMITLGRTLRLSPFPKTALAVLYIGIGGGLFFSSLASYRAAAGFFREK
ncbi:MAG: hypothetical protein JXA25_11860 [Anaerolineales bacterium]|nr:hypothetical protein [Anaerolineales bacterium]